MPKAKNRLHANYVDRIAIVDRPAVPDAQIVVFKSLKEDAVEKNANSFLDLPVAPNDTIWDVVQAQKRVKEWAGGDKVDWVKYSKAFLLKDLQNAENEVGYKLQYADVIEGELVVVPKALIAIVGAIAGNEADIPREDSISGLIHCKMYYKKMGMDFPAISIKSWEDPSIFEKDFNSGFCFRATEAAVDALQCEVYNALYSEDKANDEATIKKVFSDFMDAVLTILAKVTVTKQDAEYKLTEEDVIKPFARGLELVAMYEAFAYFKSNIAYLVAGSGNLDSPEAIVKKVIELFKEFVMGTMKNIIANKRKGDVPVFEKVGRKISTARLAKLKSLVSELSNLINEAEAFTTAEKIQEVPEMEMKEILEKLEGLTKAVEGLPARLTVIEGALKSAGMLLNAEESAARALSEKKEALAKRASDLGLAKDSTEEAIIKAESDRTVKQALEKRAEAVGLPKDSTLEAVEKKEKEVKDALEKSQKEEKEALEKRAESLGMAKDSTLEAILKKEKELAEKQITALSKSVAEIGKFVQVIGKRMGVKTSIDADIVEKSVVDSDGDPFGDMLRKGK
jgi:hypothetical protein